jgi:hypothetical protein
MKKNRILIVLALATLAVGGYFLFFLKDANPADTHNDADSTAVDSTANAFENALLEKRRVASMAEQAHPEEFVKVEIDPRKNLFGESVIEGKITNSATNTSYKDFELMIYWNDEKGMVLDSAIEVIFSTLEPKGTTDFKTKRKGPRKSKAILMNLKSAKVVAQ